MWGTYRISDSWRRRRNVHFCFSAVLLQRRGFARWVPRRRGQWGISKIRIFGVPAYGPMRSSTAEIKPKIEPNLYRSGSPAGQVWGKGIEILEVLEIRSSNRPDFPATRSGRARFISHRREGGAPVA
eukprot:1579904-Rhodomonas_salina.1